MKTLALAATLAALSVTSVADAAPAKKIVVWHAYRAKERTALEQVVAQWNGANADVQVELLPIPYDAFPDKVTASIPRGKGPDLFIFAQDRIGDWASSGLIEAVDFWVDDAMRAAYLPPTIDALTYDGALYGLPVAFKMLALYYNKKLVPKPPENTDELIAMAKAATDAPKGRYGLVYENANFYYQAAWMQGFGGRVFDKKGTPTLDAPEVIASMQFAQDLARKSGAMPQEVTSTLVTTLFNKGDAAMVLNGPWFRGEIDDKVQYGVALMPVISKSGKRATPFLTAEAVLLSAKSTQKEDAFKVMKFLTGVEAGKIMAKSGGQPSARREVYDDPAVKADPVLAVFKQQLDATVPMPNTPAMRAVWSPMTIAMNKVINGGADPAQTMKDAQAEVAKLVKGARR